MSAASRSENSLERALKLMAYADGELDGADREEVERWLAEDPDALRMATDIAHLGGALQAGFESSADAKAIASFDIADAVMAKAKAQEPERKQEAPAAVVSLAAARAARGGRGGYRVAGGVIAAMALAASIFMMARPQDEEPIARGRHAPVVAAVEPTASSSSGTPDNGVGVDINVAETAEQSVSVVYLPSENSLTTSVVLWVDETGEKK